MRITIDTDQTETKPASMPSLAQVETAGTDAGPAPAITGGNDASSSPESGASNGGEPPAWLVAEIARAASIGAPGESAAGSDDAGPAPQH